VQTNLFYYRGNYTIVCAGVALVGVLLQPALLAVTSLSAAVVGGAIAWGDTQRVPILNQPLTIEQRTTLGVMAAAVLVNMSGRTGDAARVAIVCAGLVLAHATFRARNLAARWSFFKESIE